ncbi:MAG: AAA family ATPase, partial [Dehalococcoidales bacterium]|nr:AAA family ATPase [Dehalococcoidales bacterium]
MPSAKTIMVQGTASSAGKSIIVAALCRIFRQGGLRVAPFKSQNMALNSFITADGGEIGRAQAVQAEAAGIAPTVDMNPVLLKPEADSRCQVIVRGKVAKTLSAGDYYLYTPELKSVIEESLQRLRAAYDIVVIEGAG